MIRDKTPAGKPSGRFLRADVTGFVTNSINTLFGIDRSGILASQAEGENPLLIPKRHTLLKRRVAKFQPKGVCLRLWNRREEGWVGLLSCLRCAKAFLFSVLPQSQLPPNMAARVANPLHIVTGFYALALNGCSACSRLPELFLRSKGVSGVLSLQKI